MGVKGVLKEILEKGYEPISFYGPMVFGAFIGLGVMWYGRPQGDWHLFVGALIGGASGIGLEKLLFEEKSKEGMLLFTLGNFALLALATALRHTAGQEFLQSLVLSARDLVGLSVFYHIVAPRIVPFLQQALQAHRENYQ